MKIYQDVQSTVAPQAVVIDDYSVWVADDVRNTDGCYTYTLTQYEKDEYIKLIDEKNVILEEQLTDTQLALCDVYEMIGG